VTVVDTTDRLSDRVADYVRYRCDHLVVLREDRTTKMDDTCVFAGKVV